MNISTEMTGAEARLTEMAGYSRYLRMLSGRFANFAAVDAKIHGAGSTSYYVENRERSILLAQLADLIDGTEPDPQEIAFRGTVPNAESVIAGLEAENARLLASLKEIATASIGRPVGASDGCGTVELDSTAAARLQSVARAALQQKDAE